MKFYGVVRIEHPYVLLGNGWFVNTLNNDFSAEKNIWEIECDGTWDLYDLSGNYTPVGKVIPNGGEVDTGKIDVLQIYYRPVKKPKYYAEATMMGMNPGNLYDYVMVVFE